MKIISEYLDLINGGNSININITKEMDIRACTFDNIGYELRPLYSLFGNTSFPNTDINLNVDFICKE